MQFVVGPIMNRFSFHKHICHLTIEGNGDGGFVNGYDVSSFEDNISARYMKLVYNRHVSKSDTFDSKPLSFDIRPHSYQIELIETIWFRTELYISLISTVSVSWNTLSSH
ncbi:unnamed protein product [Ambrosiozyma monospora]|uniref:Unnamed protein product n=1 Tax=Ambrosiozyma monospora TaxID=43982 RepID=A0ACB5ST08_AMBMO|nr:unnamed protein product [Ambrosiozyma monospora]